MSEDATDHFGAEDSRGFFPRGSAQFFPVLSSCASLYTLDVPFPFRRLNQVSAFLPQFRVGSVTLPPGSKSIFVFINLPQPSSDYSTL
jgi:hypothetical protein